LDHSGFFTSCLAWKLKLESLHLQGDEVMLAAKLFAHESSVFKLILAHGYVWSESIDGSHLLWQPFVCFFLFHFTPVLELTCSILRHGNIWEMLEEDV